MAKKTIKAWAILTQHGDIVSPVQKFYCYDVYDTQKDAQMIASDYSLSSNRKYDVVPCVITYSLPPKKKSK